MSELDDLLRLRSEIDRRIADVGLREVAVLFVDLVRSTARLGAQRYEEAGVWLTTFQAAASTACAPQEPVFTKTLGDGLLACFADCQRGFDAARAVLAAVREHNDRQLGVTPFSVRLALHFGPALVGSDAWGYVVNVTKRLQEASPPDTLVVSEAVQTRLSAASQFVLAAHVKIPDTSDVIRMYAPAGTAMQKPPVVVEARRTGEAPPRECVLCGRTIRLASSVVGRCPTCGGPVCPAPGCRQQLSQPRLARCRVCGRSFEHGADRHTQNNCGFCGRLVGQDARPHACSGPQCGGGAVICGPCWDNGWEFCQDDLVAGLAGRQAARDSATGLSAARFRDLATEIPVRLEANLRAMQSEPLLDGTGPPIASWQALPTPELEGSNLVRRVIPDHVYLPEHVLHRLAALLPGCATWAYEVLFHHGGSAILGLSMVVDTRALLFGGGDGCLRNRGDAQRALDELRVQWPDLTYVGLFSPTRWDGECWERPPALAAATVLLVAPAEGTTYRLSDQSDKSDAGRWCCARRFLDLESQAEKLARVRAYLATNQHRTTEAGGLSAHMVAREVGSVDARVVRLAFDELCREDGLFESRRLSDGEYALCCR